MVKNPFARWGIVQFFRGYANYLRFKWALKECDELNRTERRKYIVVRHAKRPLVINKTEFKDLKRRGYWNRDTSWGDMCRAQVTRENL